MATRKIVIDGRVFATEASERGMGRYVEHLIRAFTHSGFEVVVLVASARDLSPERLPSGARAELLWAGDDARAFTGSLNQFLVAENAAAYVDATPFLPPARYDVFACPVIAVLFDLIPMRFPVDYFGAAYSTMQPYVNGIARVKKADAVVAISHVAKRHALTYLGVPSAQVLVLEPAVRAEYLEALANSPTSPARHAPLTCIQGAHRSKNFPRAIPFLERVSRQCGCDVEVIVPTHSQRAAAEGARADPGARIRISGAVSEAEKVRLQAASLAVLHLSLEEGYGIPLVEALLLHKAVICLDTEINRELLDMRSGGDAPPGALLLDDLALDQPGTLDRVERFLNGVARDQRFTGDRAALLRRLVDLQRSAPRVATDALDVACRRFVEWHTQLGMSVTAPSELGRCGVSDYSHALLRDPGENRYAFLLGSAPQELELIGHVRLLPIEVLPLVRARTKGVLFHLAVSDALLRGFDAVADQSTNRDALVIHDAGSYLPGILMHVAASGNYRPLFDRYLRDEPSDVRMLSVSWLTASPSHPGLSEQIFLELDRNFRSSWLRSFRGRMLSHHPVFDSLSDGPECRTVASGLHADSEIRRRSFYVPMPIDARASPGVVRFARKVRWALGLGPGDVLVTCAGSVVRGKYLQELANVVCRVNRNRADTTPRRVLLMLAGRVLEPDVLAGVRRTFETAGVSESLVQLFESDETRFDSILVASDIVAAFREQRRIQMSHSLVRALALGRPVVTNEGSGFSEGAGVLVCHDAAIDADLCRHLERLIGSAEARQHQSEAAYDRYRQMHTVPAFFNRLESSNA
jgi:glycosyltransferase involved in cell wall biosynthesis